jgi:hypothetical protein
MSPPIRDGSGNSIGSIRLGDGTEISEVRTGAGDVLFSGGAIPDSQNLQTYYDPREESASDGDVISPTDQQGSLDATNGNGVEYQSSAINGQPAYYFDGATYWAQVPNSTSAFNYLHDGSGGTVYVVADIASDVGIFKRLVYNGGGGGTGVNLNTDDSGGLRYKVNNEGPNTGGGDRSERILTGVTSSTETPDLELFGDGNSLHTYDSQGFDSGDAIDNMNIGGQDGGEQLFAGYIGPILSYNVRHDSQTRSEVRDYLSDYTA